MPKFSISSFLEKRRLNKIADSKRKERTNANVLDGHTFSNKKKEKQHIIKYAQGDGDSNLIYKKGLLFRKMFIKKFEIWKELFDKGYHVEPIIEYKNIKPNYFVKLLETIGNNKSQTIIVTSKPVGYSLTGTNKMGSEKNTIQWLEKKNKIKLTDYQRLSIAKQIIKLARAIWKEGYTHNHAHSGNWTVTFKEGEPIVYLIDFDKIEKINEYDLPEEQRQIAATLYEFLRDTKYNQNLKVINALNKLITKPIK